MVICLVISRPTSLLASPPEPRRISTCVSQPCNSFGMNISGLPRNLRKTQPLQVLSLQHLHTPTPQLLCLLHLHKTTGGGVSPVEIYRFRLAPSHGWRSRRGNLRIRRGVAVSEAEPYGVRRSLPAAGRESNEGPHLPVPGVQRPTVEFRISSFSASPTEHGPPVTVSLPLNPMRLMERPR
jgi:hypothetical protein